MKYLGGDYGDHGRIMVRKTYFRKRLKCIIVYGKLFRRWKIRASDIAHVEEVNEANKVNLLGAVAGGVVGTLLAGPVGLLAGSILAGRGKKYIILIRDRKERQLLCAVNQKEYQLLLSATASGRRK